MDKEQSETRKEGGGLVNLVVDTLFALAEQPEGLSVRAIAEQTGSSRSSTHRILQYLAKNGYTEQNESGSYVVGSRLLQLSARVFGVVPVLQIARSCMTDLVKTINETCYLATYTDGDTFCTYINRVESTHLVRHIQPLGARIPLNAGAVGKAILAAIPDFDLKTLDLTRYTANTLTTIPALAADLKLTRERGYAVSVEERIIGVTGVATAIKSGDTVMGALTVSIPLSRAPTDRLKQVGESVHKFAMDLSAALTAVGVKHI
ncbi:MAG: IclR family transcriptional regulator [Rhizobiaceae bacterium]|nr:IclR family transcriptional regulator [Rhizobiaceae bacterium]